MAAEKKIKDVLLEKTAEDTKHPLLIVEDTMRWVFKDAIKAFKIHEQVEISGLGTFLMSEAKLRRRIEKLERITRLLQAKSPTEDVLLKLESVGNALQYYYSKTNELREKKIQTDLGRMEKLSISSRKDEGGNRADSERETGNMQELP